MAHRDHYDIWNYFTPEERAAACSESYVRNKTADGYCPLGVALRTRDPGAKPFPLPSDVASALFPDPNPDYDPEFDVAIFADYRRSWDRARYLAEMFVFDWDAGRIPPEALRSIIVQTEGDPQ